MKRIYITGASGTGKSTIAKRLKESGMPSFDLDKEEGLCTWIHKTTQERSRWNPEKDAEFFESNDYVCDKEKLAGLMSQHEETDEAVVVVGLCDNQAQLLDLFDKIILLTCPEEVFLKRINEREQPFGKGESEKQMILGWYKDVEKESLENGAITINVDQPIEEVMNEVIKLIKS